MTRDGRVVAHHGRQVVVEDVALGLIPCHVRKRLGQVVCGDRVRWERTAPGQGVVVSVAPRRNLLARPDPRGKPRPLAANIDQILVVVAPRPPFSERLIDRYLVAAELAGTETAIVINKADLLGLKARAEVAERLRRYPDIGYPVTFAHTRSREGVATLDALLSNRTSILVGQSGVGKSSLVRALLPDQEVRVSALSDATGLGRHTTTHTALYPLPGGGSLIDSPGVRDFQLWQVEPRELQKGFREFRSYLGRCRFNDCLHRGEPGCAVEAAVASGEIAHARLESYRELLTRAATRRARY